MRSNKKICGMLYVTFLGMYYNLNIKHKLKNDCQCKNTIVYSKTTNIDGIIDKIIVS